MEQSPITFHARLENVMRLQRENGVDNFDALSRLACVAVGVTICAAVTIFIFPVFSLNNLQTHLSQSINSIQELIEKRCGFDVRQMAKIYHNTLEGTG
jgi:TRAP-type uncharacterized transport system fused permease subunit